MGGLPRDTSITFWSSAIRSRIPSRRTPSALIQKVPEKSLYLLKNFHHVTLSLYGCRKILLHGQNNESSFYRKISVVFGNLEPYARVWLCRLRCPLTRLVYPGHNLHLVISKNNMSTAVLRSRIRNRRIRMFWASWTRFRIR